ncbi:MULTISPECIES: mismatch-specific DNA-glycosylase [Microbacterium]|uniref:mismatch-specific DNA-glycosylase n=1 Tax=Microbacterium TaxID=33882 RepID=UPI0023DBA9DA|nr:MULTISPECIES: mismatch-specific DNA-glycosylase [Microbacterium]MDF2045729.1 mismatch-specific DNA-glycosylase [Microbacterium sp. Kw_RZR3]MDQ1077289.1 TDG/mug DNA glycosylase family protein [Microbacterium sp. SORGH_AS_0969]MDQ1117533.1 TDG/mug DNA glycosylase family protein [Microbacterium testaceum]
MGYTRAELESFRDATIPDLVEPGVRLLFVGINPGLWTAATGTPFSRPGNRFWPALVEAGILPRLPRYAEPLSDADRSMILGAGLGVSNLVARATARADELSREELRAGAAALTERVAAWRPRAIAVVGLTAYREGFQRPRAVAGRQDDEIAGVPTWVLPNPSGLNAHDTVATLARAYAEPARAAGVLA